ncbi:odorant receptor 22c-like [Venturia canescens]|uniref:odorant receptor 22c-like n=1 Tax=Venturia canescens TaxID=32260 RepID=UPI001C9D1131|nr:odorant receptor 22c-like [Venturia canescens]
MVDHDDPPEDGKKRERRNSAWTDNANCGADIEYAIQMNRWLLKPLGVWPHISIENSSVTAGKLVNGLLVVSTTFLLGFILLPGSLYTIIKEKKTDVRVKLIGALSFCVMAILKYISMLTGHDEIGNCIEHLVKDWRCVANPEDRRTMLSHALFGRYGTVVCAIFMYGGGLFYAIIMPLLRGSIFIPEANLTIRPLAYPSYYVLFDPQIQPFYEMVFATHCCCAFVMHTIATAGCGLGVLFVMHACGQLEILVAWLNSLVESHSKEGSILDARIARIINQHVRVLRFITSTESVLRNICLVEIGGCTLNLCLLGHYFLLEWEQSDAIAILTYTILLASFTFNILLFCYIGELLTEECKKIGETTYMIDWYRLPSKKALGLILTIATSNRPSTITAGQLIDLSLGTFCSVVRTSVTYLNLLRTLIL